MTGSDPILVVGAVNIDILADYDSTVAKTIDKPGDVTYAIGGTAFNIAANLSSNNHPVALFSALAAESPFTAYIREELDRRDIDTTYITDHPGIAENAFIGLREEGDLTTAVSSSGLAEVTFDTDQLEQATEQAAFVVADCNLTGEQLDTVVTTADKSDTAVFVAGVSEAKATRVHALTTSVDTFLVNEAEAAALTEEGQERPVLEDLPAETLVVTRGAEGYTIYRDGAEPLELPAPSVSSVQTTTGAGDAVLSGICHAAYQQNAKNGSEPLSWDEVASVVNAYVASVLQRTAATTGPVPVNR